MGCFGNCLNFRRRRSTNLAIVPTGQASDQPQPAKDYGIFCVSQTRSYRHVKEGELPPIKAFSTSSTPLSPLPRLITVRPLDDNQQQCSSFTIPRPQSAVNKPVIITKSRTPLVHKVKTDPKVKLPKVKQESKFLASVCAKPPTTKEKPPTTTKEKSITLKEKSPTAKEKSKIEEQKALDDLKEVGLVPEITGRYSCGVSFNLVPPERPKTAKPPERLEKTKIGYKKELTTGEIREKMSKAEERRIEYERQRIKKLRTAVKNPEEQKAREALKDEGFVDKPIKVTAGGYSYAIVPTRPKSARPPKRLEEMKDKKVELTDEQIRQKLLEADRRRKAREEERVLKVRAMEKTETAEVIEAYKQEQKMKEEEITRKMNQVVEARANRLKSIRDKMKAKDRHAKLVRTRKDLNLDDMDPECSKPAKPPDD